MKAMLLAAGLGKRMRPLTDSCPKPLLPIPGGTLIEHHIKKLVEIGVRDIVINTHYLGHMIEAHLGDGAAHGANISYSREERLLETGGGIKAALGLLRDDPFIVVSSDTYNDFNFERMPTRPGDGSIGCLVMTDNPPHHLEGDFSLKGGWLGHDKPHLTWTGIGLFTPEFIHRSVKKEYKLREIFDSTIRKGQLEGIYHGGYWCDVGTPERYEDLQKHLSSQTLDQ